jgi:hypothetical protein
VFDLHKGCQTAITALQDEIRRLQVMVNDQSAMIDKLLQAHSTERGQLMDRVMAVSDPARLDIYRGNIQKREGNHLGTIPRVTLTPRANFPGWAPRNAPPKPQPAEE